MTHPLLTKSWLRHWLVCIAAALVLAACGGRSDEDVIAPSSITDANTERDTAVRDVQTDADAAQTNDALVETGLDASIDATRPDAFPDASIDARVDAPVDARVDARP